MAQVKFVPLLLLLIVCRLIMFPCFSISDGNDYVEEACSVTRYHDLCVRSLTPFANTAKDNPSIWARAGVSVTIREAKAVAQYLKTLTINHRKLGGRYANALSDCVDSFQTALDNLHMSLDVLRKLSATATEFTSQVEDVTTWVSAALTDEDTCLDGFEEDRRAEKRLRNLMISRVSNTSYLTSNALALVNKLATTGP
ncbi:hypothetical protein ACS0TY_007834 [Phlomoides rotata]